MRLQKRLYILVTIWVTIRGNTEHLGMARLPQAAVVEREDRDRPTMDEDSPRPESPDEAGAPRLDDASSINLKHVLIKWTGSKRRQAKQIVAKFPRQIATYYEPFLGGGSVLYELLGSDIEVGQFECSDICEPLIALWQVVKDDPNGLVEE
jgi:hypothetical protein